MRQEVLLQPPYFQVRMQVSLSWVPMASHGRVQDLNAPNDDELKRGGRFQRYAPARDSITASPVRALALRTSSLFCIGLDLTTFFRFVVGSPFPHRSYLVLPSSPTWYFDRKSAARSTSHAVTGCLPDSHNPSESLPQSSSWHPHLLCDSSHCPFGCLVGSTVSNW